MYHNSYSRVLCPGATWVTTLLPILPVASVDVPVCNKTSLRLQIEKEWTVLCAGFWSCHQQAELHDLQITEAQQ